MSGAGETEREKLAVSSFIVGSALCHTGLGFFRAIKKHLSICILNWLVTNPEAGDNPCQSIKSRLQSTVSTFKYTGFKIFTTPYLELIRVLQDFILVAKNPFTVKSNFTLELETMKPLAGETTSSKTKWRGMVTANPHRWKEEVWL